MDDRLQERGDSLCVESTSSLAPILVTHVSHWWPFPRQKAQSRPQTGIITHSVSSLLGNAPSNHLRWRELPSAWDPLPQPIVPELGKAGGVFRQKEGALLSPHGRHRYTVGDMVPLRTTHLHSKTGPPMSSSVTVSPQAETSGQSERRMPAGKPSVTSGLAAVSTRLGLHSPWAASPQ